jgi:hypothetical protein
MGNHALAHDERPEPANLFDHLENPDVPRFRY